MFLLVKAGLLDEKQTTTQWEDQIELQNMFLRVSVIPGKLRVDTGRVVTSTGISKNPHPAARLISDELVKNIRQMKFDWKPEKKLRLLARKIPMEYHCHPI